jgi:type I restriction enzyme, S subunit
MLNRKQKNIPEGWNHNSFKDSRIAVVDGDRGINYPKQDDFSSDGFCLFLNANNVSKNGFIFNETKFISKEKSNLMGKGKLLRNDLVITTRGTVGNVAYYDESVGFDNIRINSGMAIIRNENKNIKNKFLLYFLNSPYFKKEIKRVVFGSAQPQLTIQIINKLKLLFPPLPEQNRIVEVLETWDKYLEDLTSKIKLKKKVKKGLMQKLLNGDKRLKGFDAEWKKVKLGDVCKRIRTGKLDANAMVKNGKYRFYTCAKEYFKIDDYAFDTEALLVSGNGANVGYIHYYKGKFNAYQRTYVLDNFKSDIIFIKYILDKNLKKRIYEEKCDGNTPYIKMNTLTDMTIEIPELKEQQAIAEVLTKADQEIEGLEKKKKIVEEQKKYLLNNLITGKIRVPIKN